jgi:predicted DNA-binding transcriptional regulator YafY
MNAKFQSMTRPTAHVLTLLELLQSGGTRTAAELAGRLGVDERTVRRYVDHLTDLDIPVESVRGRYGGFRLAPGYRLPPLMLTDDEALAVLLGLIAGQRSGLTTATGLVPGGTAGTRMGTAGETAAAKIRRVLPARLTGQLEAVLESVAFTDPAGTRPANDGSPAAETSAPGTSAPENPVPDTAVLLSIADAVRHHRPVSVRYTAGDGRRSERTLHPYGLVIHSGRWYVTGADPAIGEDRTFRLDRITDARIRPGSFEPPEGLDPAAHVLERFATAPYRHHVIVWIDGTVERIRARFPASVATVTDSSGARAMLSRPGKDDETGRWLRVELRAEQLGWLPPLLASLDLPFVIEQPDELRDLIAALASRLADSARRALSGQGAGAQEAEDFRGVVSVEENVERVVELQLPAVGHTHEVVAAGHELAAHHEPRGALVAVDVELPPGGRRDVDEGAVPGVADGAGVIGQLREVLPDPAFASPSRV